MLKFELKSGARVEYNLASIEQALRLYRGLISECKNAGLDITIAEGTTVADIVMNNKEAILNIIGSANILDCIKDCCDKVLYNGKRFSMELFEEEKARQDFFPLMVLVGVENVRPFFPDLHTAYSVILSLVLKP